MGRAHQGSKTTQGTARMTATAERYARATRSSHLRMTEEPGDVDTIVAAGMSRENMGTSLLRLQTQYDSTSRTPANNSLTEHLLILMDEERRH